MSGSRTAGFDTLVAPFRRDVQLHCYRMLGSIADAEDAAQETLLRAWNGLDRFRGDAAPRTWLLSIATNVSLNMIAARKARRRRLPGPDLDGERVTTDADWLDPYPDALVESVADPALSPAARYEQKQAVELAFLLAIQRLPARQRAALLLSDVLGFSVQEVAGTLETTPAATNSMLQRARSTLARYPVDAPVLRPGDPAATRLLQRYVEAWEMGDMDGFIALLRDDATYVMPPYRQWFTGAAAIRDFFASAWHSGRYHGFRLLPTTANGLPAVAIYSRPDTAQPWAAHSLQLLAISGEHRVVRITAYVERLAPPLFQRFGLPLSLPPNDATR